MPVFVARYKHSPHSVGMWRYRSPTIVKAQQVAKERFGDTLISVLAEDQLQDESGTVSRDRFARVPWPGPVRELARIIGAQLGR